MTALGGRGGVAGSTVEGNPTGSRQLGLQAGAYGVVLILDRGGRMTDPSFVAV